MSKIKQIKKLENALRDIKEKKEYLIQISLYHKKMGYLTNMQANKIMLEYPEYTYLLGDNLKFQQNIKNEIIDLIIAIKYIQIEIIESYRELEGDIKSLIRTYIESEV